MNDLLSMALFGNIDGYDAVWLLVTAVGLLFASILAGDSGVGVYAMYTAGWNGEALMQAWDDLRIRTTIAATQLFLLFAGYQAALRATPAGGYTIDQIHYRLGAIGVSFILTLVLGLSYKTRRDIRRKNRSKH